MPRYFVYVLTCSDRTMYTGYTTDIARRLHEHNSGEGARYTSGRRPVVLSYLEEVSSKAEALRRELQIKRMSRSSKLLLCRRNPPVSTFSLR